MSTDGELAQLARAHGILLSYRDMSGQERVATPDTLRPLLAANGVAAECPGSVRDSLSRIRRRRKERRFPEEVVIESLRETRLEFGSEANWQLRCDTGDDAPGGGAAADTIVLPALASGVYSLEVSLSGRRESVTIIAAPARAPGVQEIVGMARIWGINLALYGLRSSRNAGMGDFSDLAEMSRVAGLRGASFVGTNPVHAMGYSDPLFSPYSPSHRGFLNTAHIALDAVPGLESSPNARRILSQADSELAELRTACHVEYDRHTSVHHRLMTALYDTFRTCAPNWAHTEFALFRKEHGNELAKFAQFGSIAEQHGPDWRTWPPSVYEAPNADREDFHIWLQWVADHQLGNAQRTARDNGAELGLYLDLAVGSHRNGAESWCERDSIAKNVSVGTPPDHLNPEGQNWNLAAYSPRKLAAQNYRPYRRLLATTMRHAGVVRIDHVLGLNRSFWIPDDGSPGGYVRQPFEALLAILKIEAERSGTVVIGEDLGLVPRGFRRSLHNNGIYGYSVVQYDRDRKGRLQPANNTSTQVLSCFSTHDTPTVRGFEIGRDIEWWQRLGWVDEQECAQARTRRRNCVNDLAAQRLAADFTTTVHTLLAQSPATMVTVQLDDILEHEDAQNLPGTTNEHLNWRQKYDIEVELLPKDQRFRALCKLMNEVRGTSRPFRAEEMSHEH